MIEKNFLKNAALLAASQTTEAGVTPIIKWGNGKTLYIAKSKENITPVTTITIDKERFFIGTKKNSIV